MPPRLSLTYSTLQWRSFLPQLTASLTTTSNKAALRKNPSPSSSLLGLDDSTSSSSSSRTAPSQQTSTEALIDLYRKGRDDRRTRQAEKNRELAARFTERNVSDSYLRQMPRRWKKGDVYAPHDLSPEEAAKWRKPTQPKKDALDVLGLNPVDEYRNFSIISEYMTPMGRIKHSKETGLRPVNQRKMAKAIRRAIGLGLHPSVHRHPELLRMQLQNLAPQIIPTPQQRQGYR